MTGNAIMAIIIYIFFIRDAEMKNFLNGKRWLFRFVIELSALAVIAVLTYFLRAILEPALMPFLSDLFLS